jgi:hypothetical protein
MLDLANYSVTAGEILHSLDDGARRMPLAPKGPAEGAGLARLRKTGLKELFDNEPIASPEFAACVRSAMFLYFSALDESHTISQGIETPTGSFLHAIMHRQEPDYSNAKYWVRRTGSHELYPTLREDSMRLRLKGSALPETIKRNPRWDPMWFVDQVERAVGGDPLLESDLMEVQRLEWDLLFDYSYRRALSG